MYQDKITGLYHFQGDEQEDVWSYFWSCIMDLSFKGRVETVLRTIFKRPPAWVGYKKPEYYQERSLIELKKMAGKPHYQHCDDHQVIWDAAKGQTHDCKEGVLVRDKDGNAIASIADCKVMSPCNFVLIQKEFDKMNKSKDFKYLGK